MDTLKLSKVLETLACDHSVDEVARIKFSEEEVTVAVMGPGAVETLDVEGTTVVIRPHVVVRSEFPSFNIPRT